MLADSGYASEETFARAGADGLRLLAPLAKAPGPAPRPDPATRPAPGPAPGHRPRQAAPVHPRGRDGYKLRAQTVEPVFGQLQTCQKLTMMSRRSLTACQNEWLLACAAHNCASCTGTALRANCQRPAPGSRYSRPPKTAQDRSLGRMSRPS